MSSLYCSTPLPDYAEDICANEPGRIIAVAIMRSDHTVTDPTSASLWNSNITAGRVVILKNVRGDKPKSTDVQGDGFGRQQTRSISRDFVANYKHPSVIGNEDFYNVLNYDNGHSFWFYTQGQKIWDSGDAIANFDSDFTIEEGLNTFIMWDVTVTWSTEDIPVASDASAISSIFE